LKEKFMRVRSSVRLFVAALLCAGLMLAQSVRVLTAQNPTKQKAEFGFSRPALPPWGFDPILDRALAVLKDSKGGALLFRELDAWTGLRHFQYNLPGGLPVNANIWTLDADGSWFWLDDSGVKADPPKWAPPFPGSTEKIVLEFEPDPLPPPVVEKPAVGTWMGGKYFASPNPDEPTPDGGVLEFQGKKYQKHIAQTPFGTARWWELAE
jgi:hypothetical protein